MPDLSDLTDGVLDDDGYPTDDALALIPTWTGTPRALVEDLLDPIFEAYGGITVEPALDDFDRPVQRVRLVTGGWSGNESAITALEVGLFWFAWWEASERGGAYTFKVPADAWDEPIGEWPRIPTAFDNGRKYGWGQAYIIVAAAIHDVRCFPDLAPGITAVLDRLAAELHAGPPEEGR